MDNLYGLSEYKHAKFSTENSFVVYLLELPFLMQCFKFIARDRHRKTNCAIITSFPRSLIVNALLNKTLSERIFGRGRTTRMIL